MEQKVAIVTGGASGLGLAIAERFIREKISTVIIGRDQEKLNAAKEKLGCLCYTYAADLIEQGAIPALVSSIKNDLGRIDILVNNAGINLKKEMTDVTDTEFQQILQTNVSGVF